MKKPIFAKSSALLIGIAAISGSLGLGLWSTSSSSSMTSTSTALITSVYKDATKSSITVQMKLDTSVKMPLEAFAPNCLLILKTTKDSREVASQMPDAKGMATFHDLVPGEQLRLDIKSPSSIRIDGAYYSRGSAKFPHIILDYQDKFTTKAGEAITVPIVIKSDVETLARIKREERARIVADSVRTATYKPTDDDKMTISRADLMAAPAGRAMYAPADVGTYAAPDASLSIAGDRSRSSTYIVDGASPTSAMSKSTTRVESSARTKKIGRKSKKETPLKESKVESTTITKGESLAWESDMEVTETSAKTVKPSDPGPVIEETRPVKTSGIMTAGERNDIDKWDEWLDVVNKAPANERPYLWSKDLQAHFPTQVKDKKGKPIPNAEIIIEHKTNHSQLYAARTGESGSVELLPALGQMSSSNYVVKVKIGPNTYDLGSLSTLQRGKNNNLQVREYTYNETPKSEKNQEVEVVFCIDATGSMSDEMNYIANELDDVVKRVKGGSKDISLKMGSVYYRDKGDDYVTRTFQLTEDMGLVQRQIAEQRADGGGDFPEAVDAALDNAVNRMNWSSTATTKIMFLILDAPPHDDAETKARMEAAVSAAAAKGIRIIPVTASGINKVTEYMMRAIAIRTQGTYVFITDHSGVGDSHMAPSVSDYKVEFLNDLMVRLILKYIKEG